MNIKSVIKGTFGALAIGAFTIFAGAHAASASAVLTPINPMGPANSVQMMPSPSILGNYIKTNEPLGGALGLGIKNSYKVVPLSYEEEVSEPEGMWMESTAYSAYETSPYTATGESVRYGIAAVDTNLIPLGTSLYIEGYGHALAADTGGAIRGNRIDLAFDSHQDALSWGRRDVMVYVL